jgi:hypothetical protein
MKQSIGLATAHPAARVACSGTVAMAMALLFSFGCRSDLSQQLLERELRMQEDQIYQLQDELQDASARLDRTAGENSSLKRQLGFGEVDGQVNVRGPLLRGGQPPPPRSSPPQPQLVPPKIDVPGFRSPSSGPAAPIPGPPPAAGTVAPPTLDGIPPLPSEPRFPGAALPAPSSVSPASAVAPVGGVPPTVVPAPMTFDADARPLAPSASPTSDPPAGRRLSHEESLADAGRITHLVVNPSRTECFDGDGDGLSDGLAIVIEPRDGDERLVTAAGDVSITVFDSSISPAAGPVARWDIPAQEALARFRRTSRNRGLHFVLRWPGPPPQGDHVRVRVGLTTFDAAVFEAECTVAAAPALSVPSVPTAP